MKNTSSSKMSQLQGYGIPQKTDMRLSDDTIRVGIIDLIVGVSLRGWLTDHEMNFLDNLGMEKAAIFLIRDGRYLHPDEVELFPIDVIDASIRQGGDAVFSHRHTSSSTSTSHVHTATINDTQSHTDILGLIGPDELLPNLRTEDWFCHLVELFRETTALTSNIQAQLNDRLTDNVATVIINRSSGRVLYINEQAEQLLKVDPKEITGCEYGRVRHILSRSLSSHKITIDNLDLGELYLSTVTLRPVKDKNPIQLTDKADLRDRLRDHLDTMQAATHQMEQVGESLGIKAVIETALGVRKEVVRLSHRLLEPNRPERLVRRAGSQMIRDTTDKVEIL